MTIIKYIIIIINVMKNNRTKKISIKGKWDTMH